MIQIFTAWSIFIMYFTLLITKRSDGTGNLSKISSSRHESFSASSSSIVTDCDRSTIRVAASAISSSPALGTLKRHQHRSFTFTEPPSKTQIYASATASASATGTDRQNDNSETTTFVNVYFSNASDSKTSEPRKTSSNHQTPSMTSDNADPHIFLPRAKLEKEFTEYFGETQKTGSFRTTRWTEIRILNKYQNEALLELCQAAYTHSHFSTFETSIRTRILSYELRFPELLIGQNPGAKLRIDVLKCEIDKTRIFYLTKGRHPNSVYFVKPTAERYGMVQDFVFEENFESEVALDFHYKELAESVRHQ